MDLASFILNHLIGITLHLVDLASFILNHLIGITLHLVDPIESLNKDE